MKTGGLFLLAAGVLCAQAPNPVQTGVTPMPDGSVPIFRVEVTSKSITAVNYHSRQGTTRIDFRGTALMPLAKGTADVTANTGATRISLHFDHLSNPAQFGSEYLTFVLWAITPEGRSERLGEVTLKNADDKDAELYATTDLQSFGMIVTAEPYFSVSEPSDVVVMENFLRRDTTGTMQPIDAKYELLRRGQYTMNIDSSKLSALTSDVNVPLQYREALQAIAIAKAQGADHYAADTMQKAAIDMQNAAGYYKTKNWKQLDTVAREATQMAEDARRISITKEREEAEQAARDAAAAREADAKRKAADEADRRKQAEIEAAYSDRLRREAEEQKRQAELAMNEARKAQADAEAARQAALDEQAKLAAAKASADSARNQAEQDAQALRAKLKDQLNLILSTRDSARGLIVNMSDVLFDFDQATLKPDTREKLARVSGIVLAYPSLHLAVEGHTDSVGTDEYNQKLSERRANAVRDYLTSAGITADNVTAVGMGKADPVASNDTAAGRQQNRRVEMVVSGDVIGQPSDAPTTDVQHPGFGPAQYQPIQPASAGNPPKP
ncbi:MAG TPA: OmpA family protein [Bryobacteraceae bacterium]|nr:OmpA family protein [Bryobacteraceae bacterium]